MFILQHQLVHNAILLHVQPRAPESTVLLLHCLARPLRCGTLLAIDPAKACLATFQHDMHVAFEISYEQIRYCYKTNMCLLALDSTCRPYVVYLSNDRTSTINSRCSFLLRMKVLMASSFAKKRQDKTGSRRQTEMSHVIL